MIDNPELAPKFTRPGGRCSGRSTPSTTPSPRSTTLRRRARPSNGFPAARFAAGEVELCTGEWAVVSSPADDERHGLRRRLGEHVPWEESEAPRADRVRAENGASIVTVLAPEAAHRKRARDVRAAPGGHAMRDDGDGTFIDPPDRRDRSPGRAERLWVPPPHPIRSAPAG